MIKMKTGKLTNFLLLLSEGRRMLARATLYRHSRSRKFRRYDGDAVSICMQITKDCWNGRYFATSGGHYNQFYSRDFAWCASHLVRLGFRQEVQKTLEYALDAFEKAEAITTHITPEGEAVNFPSQTPESWAYLLHSIKASGNESLAEKHRELLEKSIAYSYSNHFDKERSIVRSDIYFSTIKDHSLRKSPVYLNSIVAMGSRIADELKLRNPFNEHNLKRSIRQHFWNGSYFEDDIEAKGLITGDSNVFPFWSGAFPPASSAKMLRSAVDAMISDGLDRPFPLKYTKESASELMRKNKQRFILSGRMLAPNYEGNTVWTHLGAVFIDVLSDSSSRYLKEKAHGYAEQYRELIERYRNYLEVFEPDGKKPYASPFYICDEGMLWASIFAAVYSGRITR